MPWQTLGTFAPTPEWQLFDVPVVGSGLFRAQQSYSSPLGDAWLILSSWYPNGGRSGFTRLYPTSEDTLMEMRTPIDFELAGYSVRFIAVRTNRYADVFTAANWTLTLQHWVEATDPNNNPIQLLDGGVY